MENLNNPIEKPVIRKRPVNLLGLLIIYLLCTVLLYAFGPIDWKTHNSLQTYGLIFIYIIALALGGWSVKNKFSKQEKHQTGKLDWFYRNYTWIAIFCIIMRVLSIERILIRYGYNNIFQIIKIIITDYGDLYFAESSSMGSGIWAIHSLISLIVSPLTFLFIPLSIVLFSKLKKGQKILAIIGIFLWTVYNLSQGTNIGFFTIIVVVGISFLFREKKQKLKPYKDKETNAKKIFALLFIAVLFLFAFGFSMSNRMGSSINFSQIGENSVNKNNWLYNALPDNFKNLLIWFDFYICQGYYGMSLATEVAWEPMFGMGFSRWLCLELDGILPFGVYELTYPYRIEAAGFAWGSSANWHTAFTWFANDLGFAGVILLMFLIGRLFNAVYYDVIKYKNPTDIGLLLLLVQLIVFIPCNNYIFSNSVLLFPFFAYLLLRGLRKL